MRGGSDGAKVTPLRRDALTLAAMGCPQCGGSSRRMLAPGFWECESPVQVTVPGPGYGAPPTGQYGPALVTLTQACRYRYQEGRPPGAPVCASPSCGRFAGGVATVVDAPCAGICSPCNGPLLCRQDRARASAEADAKKEAEEAEAAAKKAAEEQALAATPEAREARARSSREGRGSISRESLSRRTVTCSSYSRKPSRCSVTPSLG